MCNRKLILWLGTSLLAALLSSTSHAAKECRFGDGSTEVVTIANGTLSSVSKIHWESAKSVTGYTEIARGTGTFSPSLKSNCSMGNDGRSMWGAANNAFSNYGSVTVDGQSAQLYPTNVGGIYFAVALQTTSGGDVVYIPPYYGDGDTKKLNSMDNTTLDGATWKAIIVIFQGDTNQFSGNTGNISTLSPSESMDLGSMGLGNSSDSNNQPYYIYVDTSSFQFPIQASTCNAMTMSGGDTANTVDFGDLNLSDVENNNLPSRDFSINLSGCSNIYRIEPKVTATTTLTSGSSVLMENQLTSSNAASGIGVHLLIYDEEIVNQPDPSVWTGEYTKNTADDSSYSIPFTASLEKDGKTVKAGSFSSTATIMFTYQ